MHNHFEWTTLSVSFPGRHETLNQLFFPSIFFILHVFTFSKWTNCTLVCHSWEFHWNGLVNITNSDTFLSLCTRSTTSYMSLCVHLSNSLADFMGDFLRFYDAKISHEEKCSDCHTFITVLWVIWVAHYTQTLFYWGSCDISNNAAYVENLL